MPPKKKPRLIDLLHEPDASLATLLVKKWAWGLLSAHQVWEFASHALADEEALLKRLKLPLNFASQSLTILSAIGNRGENPGSTRRDLISALGTPPVPDPHLIRAPMQILKPLPGAESKQDVDIAIFLPHEMLSYLYTEERLDFEKKFLGKDPASLAKFWAELIKRDDPRLRNHPMVSQPDWKSRSIPISWHGDGVAAISAGKPHAKTYEVYSFSGLLAKGNSLESKIYVFGYLGENSLGQESLFPIWRKIVWSFFWAAQGRWPTHDENGRKYESDTLEGRRANTHLAGGYFLSIYVFKQDMEHLAGHYGLADYRTSDRLCPWCACTRKKDDWQMSFNNFRTDAKWRKTAFSAAEWNKAYPSPHPLFQEAHVTCLNIEPDEAHCLHLGVGQHVVGNMLWLMVFGCDPGGGSPSEKMGRLWDLIRADYAEHRVSTQMTNLKLSSFCNADKPTVNFPRLRSKAAECKDLVPVIARVWEVYKDPSDPDHRQASAMLKHLVGLQQILHDHADDPILPLSIAKQFRADVQGFLQGYSQMANAADRENLALFNMVPKFNMLSHMGDRALWVNPRKSCCLIDESYVGQMKVVVQACAHGTAAHAIQGKVAEQYRFGFFVTIKYGT